MIPRVRSIRLRLTLWYAAAIAVVLVAFAGVVYWRMRASLYEQFDDALENRAFFTQALVQFDAAGSPSLDVRETNPDADDTFERLLALDGSVIDEPAGEFQRAPVDAAALAAARDGRRHFGTLSIEGGVRVVTEPVTRDGQVVAVLQAGEETEDIRDTLSNLLFIFALALPVALAAALGGGWWLAGRALAPIDRVTRAARAISGGNDLSRRLDLGLPDDEVGRLARTFDEMLVRLDAAFRRQRQFTSDASHELRTPLAAIRGQIEVALDRPRDPAEYQRVLASVNAQVERMTRLVGGLLMLARSDAGALPLERERIDAAALVESVAEQVTPAARAKGLTVAVARDGAATVVGDQDLLLQLMLNLADNAVRYTQSGGITLGWRQAGGLELYVRDSGPGIPPEHRERIFERFYRVDAARSGDGAGLGLAISRWIAEAHGGALRVESDADGSTFTVSLPGA